MTRFAIPSHRVFGAIRVSEVAELETLVQHLPGWAFRGQEDATWPLRPSLERKWDGQGTLREAEFRELRSFRSCNPTLPVPPDDYLNWLALLQHEGRPTRLLDFTWDWRFATWFALRKPSPNTPILWAVNGYLLAALLSKQIVRRQRAALSIETPAHGWTLFNRVFPSDVTGFAAALVAPRGPNRRMIAQKGVFLCALNMDHTLEGNLLGMFGHRPEFLRDRARLRGFNKAVPAGTWMSANTAAAIRQLRGAPVIKITLCVPQQALVEDLEEHGINRRTLDPPRAEGG